MTQARSGDDKQLSEIENALNLLDAIDGETDHTQRGLAARLNVALGLANSLLKRCARKGLIKVKGAPARRFAYYLTPQGFVEKSRLVAQYLSLSLDFFRTARDQYDQAFADCDAQGWQRVALVGSGDLAEIATIASHGSAVAVKGVLAPGCNLRTICGIPVYTDLADLGTLDALLLVDSKQPQTIYDDLVRVYPAERILTPRLLRVSRGNGEKNGGAS